MGGLCEGRFIGSERGVENEARDRREWRRLVDTVVKRD